MLIPLSVTNLTGNHTLRLKGRGKCFGGLILATNGTNAGTVTVREHDAQGKILMYVSGIPAGPYLAPIRSDDADLYVSVSGTGASAFFYEEDI